MAARSPDPCQGTSRTSGEPVAGPAKSTARPAESVCRARPFRACEPLQPLRQGKARSGIMIACQRTPAPAAGEEPGMLQPKKTGLPGSPKKHFVPFSFWLRSTACRDGAALRRPAACRRKDPTRTPVKVKACACAEPAPGLNQVETCPHDTPPEMSSRVGVRRCLKTALRREPRAWSTAVGRTQGSPPAAATSLGQHGKHSKLRIWPGPGEERHRHKFIAR